MGLEFKLRAQLKLNFRLFEDTTFIRESAFSNVPSGTVFYDGSVQSLLMPDGEAHKTLGLQPFQVWQSPFRQWVYESGVALDGTNVNAPARQVSGVYVHGALRGPGDPEFGHTVDYFNGRVIFNTPHPDLSASQIHADFAYRHVRIAFEHDFNQQFNDPYLESRYATNPETSYQLIYPSGNQQPFPAVFIEVSEREFKPYELGNRSMQIFDTMNFHIWTLDDMQRDNIVDILTSQVRKTIPIIDFNIAPLPVSGLFNTLSPEYIPYQTMLRNNTLVTTVGSGVPVKYLAFIEEVDARNLPSSEEYERAIVTYKVLTQLNAPTTPLGHVFAPISTIPQIEDPPV